jgi:hypothetical protein
LPNASWNRSHWESPQKTDIKMNRQLVEMSKRLLLVFITLPVVLRGKGSVLLYGPAGAGACSGERLWFMGMV